MANTVQGAKLSGSHEGKPGLPRGRSRLPAPAVLASQRERLLRAAVAAVAGSDYATVTIADIVRQARVSRAAFYAHFSGKEDCFLAATGQGKQLLVSRVLAAARAAGPDAPDEEVLRAGCRAFLRFLADEPAFARVFYIDMPAAGPAAVRRLHAGNEQFAQINRAWHDRALRRHPEWPAVPFEACLALAGATLELVRSMVSSDRTSALPELEDTLVSLHLAVLAGRPWGAGPPGGLRLRERMAATAAAPATQALPATRAVPATQALPATSGARPGAAPAPGVPHVRFAPY
jgi:AcrR family transcriptional regulator